MYLTKAKIFRCNLEEDLLEKLGMGYMSVNAFVYVKSSANNFEWGTYQNNK